MLGALHPVDARTKQFRKLTEVSRALTYAMSLEQVLHLTVESAAALLDSEKAVLMLSNAEGLLSVRAVFGLNSAATERFREPMDETLIRRLQGLLGVDAQRFLGVPLVVGGEVTGILAVTLPPENVDSEELEWLLSALADQASVALEKTRLDESSQFRERLIGIVSHDLRNPLNAILLSTQVLLMNENLDARAAKVVTRIQSSAERAGRMIRDLLDYTQAQIGGGIHIERRPADLHAVIHQVVEEVGASHPERHIEVRTQGSAQGQWDVDRMAQVLGNLLSNAMHYSPPATPVLIQTYESGGWLNLSIHNSGEPIPTERLPYIFQPMQRAVSEVNINSRSVGLGLYIVKHLVETHGGSISVTSTAAAGTTFIVQVPRQPV